MKYKQCEHCTKLINTHSKAAVLAHERDCRYLHLLKQKKIERNAERYERNFAKLEVFGMI